MPSRGGLFVIGSGGREHALVWHLRRHYPTTPVYCAPGNPGIGRIATCLPVAASDADGLVEAAASRGVGLTIAGPEAPLVAGLADRFAARGLPFLGPSAAASALEGSKAFAKDLMRRWGIPTADYRVFDDPKDALAHLESTSMPVVVKADGLAAGKGVVVAGDLDEARAAVRWMMIDRVFGDAGRRIVIEEHLTGEEASVFALVDGEAVALLPAAQDHKRLHDGDRGPNTGGMGAAAPFPLGGGLRRRILQEILEPTAVAMCRAGRPYRGILFAGLMMTPAGPKVLEFNCRLGDPEAQVILPLLPVALPDAFHELARGRLGPETLIANTSGAQGAREASAPGARERCAAAVGVVLASAGYPEAPQTGRAIAGLEAAEGHALVFHSGTAWQGGRLVTAGGRVLTVVGRASTLRDARARAYQAAELVHFEGVQFRRDIGARVAGDAVAASWGR